jgi:regulatory protein YycI of two-component signal transduction system YycFG
VDWSKTKTIFIVTFMLLNIFLAYQLSEKQDQDRMSQVAMPELESRIDDQNIEVEISDSSLNEDVSGGPITGMYRTFQNVFLEQTLEGQQAELLDETRIYSEIDSPFSLVPANLEASLEGFLEQYVFRGEEYEVAAYNDEEGTVGLYQTFEEQKIDEYERENFHLELQINDDNEVVSYEQTYMTIVEQAEEQELLTPLEVIDILLDDTSAGIGTEATVMNAELGYYNLLEVDANFQIFAPVWRVTIDEEDYFVNAMTGEVQTIG